MLHILKPKGAGRIGNWAWFNPLIPLISIPVTNTSVNPARRKSQAIFVGDWAMRQLWLFWVTPIVGAILAGIVYKYISPETEG